MQIYKIVIKEMNMFNKKSKDHLELICPECDKNTKIKTEDGVSCSNCNESFKGMAFTQDNLVTKTAAYLIVAGAIGGVALNNKIEDSRLPYAAEYKLMDTCVNAYSGMVNAKEHSDRIDLCSCAVRKSVNNLGVGSDRNEPDEVLEAFSHDVRSAAKEC